MKKGLDERNEIIGFCFVFDSNVTVLTAREVCVMWENRGGVRYILIELRGGECIFLINDSLVNNTLIT